MIVPSTQARLLSKERNAQGGTSCPRGSGGLRAGENAPEVRRLGLHAATWTARAVPDVLFPLHARLRRQDDAFDCLEPTHRLHRDSRGVQLHRRITERLEPPRQLREIAIGG